MPRPDVHLELQKRWLPHLCRRAGVTWSGKLYPDVDKWMDDGVGKFGKFHRIIKHGPDVVTQIYHQWGKGQRGWEASMAARLHLAFDMLERSFRKIARKWGNQVYNHAPDMWDDEVG